VPASGTGGERNLNTGSLSFPLPALLAGEMAAHEPAAPAAADRTVLSDDALLAQVARRDADAFSVLYRRYERPIFTALLRLAGQRALAEEWLQETFTRVWLAAASHDAARGQVKPWIYAIALNTARGHRRERTVAHRAARRGQACRGLHGGAPRSPRLPAGGGGAPLQP
jgi:hypothetical protein